MYLKSIEIYGFKSFAKKSFLEFNSSISAIVGPNGSGKSNIAEAFRFVLGEQSIKSLRGKRGEDLIFNGGDDVPRMNRASVKLIFDNKRRILSLDFDEVEIERVVHRDSENQYFLNKSLVRLKDIHELLASAHIGSTGHHIISQGEADKILSANPKERKQTIEDALGLKIYQIRKEESIKKIDKTLENIKSVESLRREIAPHLRFLRKQLLEVEKIKELKIELKQLYSLYLPAENYFIKKEVENISLIRNPLLEEKKVIEGRIEDIKKLLYQSDENTKLTTLLLDQESQFEKIREEKSMSILELGRLQGELSFLNRTIKGDSEIRVSSKDVVPQINELWPYFDSIEISDDIEKIKETIKSIREGLKTIYSLFEKDNNTNEIEAEISEFNKKITVIEETLEQKTNEEKQSLRKINEIKEEFNKEKNDDRVKEREVFVLMNDQRTIINDISKTDLRTADVSRKGESLKKESYEAGMLIGLPTIEYMKQDGEYVERSIQDERLKKIERIKILLEEGSGGGDEIIKEFEDVTTRDKFLEKEVSDLSLSLTNLEGLIKELEIRIAEEFEKGMSSINIEFHKFFSLMFDGGSASLKTTYERRKKITTEGVNDISEADIENENGGVEIEISLPRKKIKGLTMLSGGERALTSIALLFAISQVNPPPFVILDETDAALDEANSKKYGDMIVNLSEHSQLILITHNRETMSRAGVLYGVTMGTGGVSKLLSVKFETAISVAK